MKLINIINLDDKILTKRLNIIKKVLIIYSICAIVIVPLLVIYFWIDYKQYEKKNAYIRANYPLTTTVTRLTGVVSKIIEDPFIHIEISNGGKYILGSYMNEKEMPFIAAKFIMLGDSIYKEAGSDTLFVYRDTIEYFFID